MHEVLATTISTNDAVTPIVIALLGSGGFVGAIVALIKLKPDINNAAVTQAAGALEMMGELLEDTERDRDYWRGRYSESNKKLVELSEELSQARQMIRHLSSSGEDDEDDSIT